MKNKLQHDERCSHCLMSFLLVIKIVNVGLGMPLPMTAVEVLYSCVWVVILHVDIL